MEQPGLVEVPLPTAALIILQISGVEGQRNSLRLKLEFTKIGVLQVLVEAIHVVVVLWFCISFCLKKKKKMLLIETHQSILICN